MKVTFTAYRKATTDSDGQVIGVPDTVILETNGKQVATAAGTLAALPDETYFLRVGSDTNIHFRAEGVGADTTDPQVFASAPEFFAVREGQTPSFIVA